MKNHSGKSTLRKIEKTTGDYETVSTIDHTVINSIVPKHSNYIVKIDVEGHEEIVISELIKSSFFEKVRLLFCEVDEKWIQSERLIVTLATAGLEVVEKSEKIPHTMTCFSNVFNYYNKSRLAHQFCFDNSGNCFSISFARENLRGLSHYFTHILHTLCT